MLFSFPGICVKDTGTPRGRGVFALRAFQPGEVVEACPVVVLALAFDALPDQLKKLVFDWGVLAGVPGTLAVAHGYGSMYNHNNPANMRYEAVPSEALLRFVAVRPIDAGEELTINYNAYGGVPEWNEDENWFERMNEKPIVEP